MLLRFLENLNLDEKIMQLTPKEKEKILELINSNNFIHPKLKKVARVLNILPIFSEMGGWYGLTLTGNIVSASWDELPNIRIEADERVCNLVLFQGIKNYPDLSSLTPVKKDSDEICAECEGTGIHPLSHLNIGCYCGGLGWIPKPKTD